MNELVLKAMGARVQGVDEHGDVTLFCYSEDMSIDMHVGSVEEAKRWGARIGDYVTVQVLAEKYEPPPNESEEERKGR